MGRSRDTSKILKELDERIFISSASPSNNIDGRIWIDTTSASAPVMQVYAQNEFKNPRTSRVKALGGNITNSGSYTIHTFLGSSTFTALETLNVEYLVVAGGGGAGFDVGGGGGAGGLILGSSTINNAGQYVVQVGGGGVSAASGNNGGDGANSSFLDNVGIGGGGGGTFNVTTSGRPGGSGGGAGLNNSGGAGTPGQGFAGGSAGAAYGSGGGGGAGGLGGTGTPGNTTAGGLSVSSSITGSPINYSGGGYGNSDGGAVRLTGNNFSNQNIGDYGFGANGTGLPNQNPYNGNSGIIIIRYLT